MTHDGSEDNMYQDLTAKQKLPIREEGDLFPVGSKTYFQLTSGKLQVTLKASSNNFFFPLGIFFGKEGVRFG